MKTCPECTNTKPFNEYHVNKRSKDGMARICKECKNAYQRAWKPRKKKKVKKVIPKSKAFCNYKNKTITRTDCIRGINVKCNGCPLMKDNTIIMAAEAAGDGDKYSGRQFAETYPDHYVG